VSADPIMAEIMRAGAPLQRGDRVAARIGLEAVWARISANPEPMHEVALAHSIADTQDDP
jgi:hypothetical protein